MTWLFIIAIVGFLAAVAISIPYIHRRIGTPIDGRNYSYGQIRQLSWGEGEQLLRKAFAEQNNTAVKWILSAIKSRFGESIRNTVLSNTFTRIIKDKNLFETYRVFKFMLDDGQEAEAWRIFNSTADWSDEELWDGFMFRVIEDGIEPPPDLNKDDLEFNMKLGTAYLGQAKKNVGVKDKKDDMARDKTHALRHLAIARNLAIDVAIVASLAATYDQALYLMWGSAEAKPEDTHWGGYYYGMDTE